MTFVSQASEHPDQSPRATEPHAKRAESGGAVRVCNACGEPKLLETAFYRRTVDRAGRQRTCIECQRRHPGRHPERQHRALQRRPARVCLACYGLAERLEARCSRCGLEPKP